MFCNLALEAPFYRATGWRPGDPWPFPLAAGRAEITRLARAMLLRTLGRRV